MRFTRIQILIVVSVILFSACKHKKETLKEVTSDVSIKKRNPLEEKLGLSGKEIRHSRLYSFIDDWYGVPYKYGGCQKTGVDCSCFTDILYENVYGVKTPRNASDIYKQCDKISIEKIKEGDLVFFITSGKNISHVGVYLKNDKFVHASTSKGVMINDLKEPYYKKTFYSAGKLKHSLSWKD